MLEGLAAAAILQTEPLIEHGEADVAAAASRLTLGVSGVKVLSGRHRPLSTHSGHPSGSSASACNEVVEYGLAKFVDNAVPHLATFFFSQCWPRSAEPLTRCGDLIGISP